MAKQKLLKPVVVEQAPSVTEKVAALPLPSPPEHSHDSLAKRITELRKGVIRKDY